MNFLHALSELVGKTNVLTGKAAAPYLVDWRERYHGQALAVVRPGTTDEVASVIRACAAAEVPVVPQGGNTGLCGGATPDDSGRALVLSLQRLNRVRYIDQHNNTMTVEAGCVLQTIQETAGRVDRLFPLSLTAEGSCTIGGNLATNAGGTQVLRYGSMRELTLGLEVVTADGAIWDGLRGLRKDNTGYALRDLFIGSEGTLGIITAATLKLHALPLARATAFLALESIEAAMTTFAHARHRFDAALTGFELIDATCMALVAEYFPRHTLPFDRESAKLPWFVLIELSDNESETHAQQRLETVLGQAIESGFIKDAVIASSIAQSKALWQLRESVPLAEKVAGKAVKHDISVPLSRMASFVRDTRQILEQAFPGVCPLVFGHLGDGNLHYNVTTGTRWDQDQLLERQHEISTLVHDQVHAIGGSISAEHGIGQLKRTTLTHYKSVTELALMRSLKRALDPRGIMNPGKLLID